MLLRAAAHFLLLGSFSLFASPVLSFAQSIPAYQVTSSAHLEFVVMLTRHGVRTPLGHQADLDKFSAAPWPKWDVAPGIQTDHGNELIRLFGEWDRAKFSGAGLLAASGCSDASHVTILADTDQRTRETGRMLAEGIFPGCSIQVHSQPDGATDPLFQPFKAGIAHVNSALAAAAIAGRIGGSPKNLTEAYASQLSLLDRVLAGCGQALANSKRTSILSVPSSLTPGADGSLPVVSGPVLTAATLVENFLLEYTQGMAARDVGWGCVDGATLRNLMQIDTARWDYGLRTLPVARPFASDLLDHILMTMQQNVTGQPVPGAIGNPGDRLVILAGHDTNIVAVAGALGMNWVLDGRIDDPAPGGALLFELWRSGDGAQPFVRVEYSAQTLEQMRNAQKLTPTNPPGVAQLFIPGCSRQDLSCTWSSFSAQMSQAIDPADVAAEP